jgi:uncharacterized glyoxalase superfamily protein PhnB
MSDFKRPNLPTVMPYLAVAGAGELMAFMKNVFGAEEIECHREPSGRIAHASMRIGDSVIEMGDANEQWGSTPAALHVYVPDVDRTFATALANDATTLYKVADQPYGERSGGFKDRWGNSWYAATILKPD